jgi:hypothetical protein
MTLPRLFQRKPLTIEEEMKRSAYVDSAVRSLSGFRAVVKPISRERALAALARSRARRAANGD